MVMAGQGGVGEPLENGTVQKGVGLGFKKNDLRHAAECGMIRIDSFEEVSLCREKLFKMRSYLQLSMLSCKMGLEWVL